MASMHLIEPILHQMSSVAKPQRKFMFVLLTAAFGEQNAGVLPLIL
jgi:hypothetical protein